jgi:hypothetical protein
LDSPVGQGSGADGTIDRQGGTFHEKGMMDEVQYETCFLWPGRSYGERFIA